MNANDSYAIWTRTRATLTAHSDLNVVAKLVFVIEERASGAIAEKDDLYVSPHRRV